MLHQWDCKIDMISKLSKSRGGVPLQLGCAPNTAKMGRKGGGAIILHI